MSELFEKERIEWKKHMKKKKNLEMAMHGVVVFVPFEKKSERNGCSTKTVHIWPYVGKAKMRLIGSSFLKNCLKNSRKM